MSEETKGTAKQGSEVMLYPMPEVRPISDRPVTFLVNVDQIVSKLWPRKEFRQYLNAVTNKSAVEGKFESDRTLAAKQIRDEAENAKMMEVASAKLSRIMRAIETLMRRDDLGRKQRLAALNAPQPAPAE